MRQITVNVTPLRTRA